MLLKTTFLESVSRYDFCQDKEFPLTTIYQFSKTISVYKNFENQNNTPRMVSCAWFIWNKEKDKDFQALTVQWIRD